MDKKASVLMGIEAYALPSDYGVENGYHVFVVNSARDLEWRNAGGGWKDTRPRTLIARTQAYKEWLCAFIPPSDNMDHYEKGGIVFGTNGVCHTIANRVLAVTNSRADASHAPGDEHSILFFGKYGYGIEQFKNLLKTSYAKATETSTILEDALTSVFRRIDNSIFDELAAWKYIAIQEIGIDVDAILLRDASGGINEAMKRLSELIAVREALYQQYKTDRRTLLTEIKKAINARGKSYLEYLASLEFITTAEVSLFSRRIDDFLEKFIVRLHSQVEAIQRGDVL